MNAVKDLIGQEENKLVRSLASELSRGYGGEVKVGNRKLLRIVDGKNIYDLNEEDVCDD